MLNKSLHLHLDKQRKSGHYAGARVSPMFRKSITGSSNDNSIPIWPLVPVKECPYLYNNREHLVMDIIGL